MAHALGHTPEYGPRMCCFLALCSGARVLPALRLSVSLCEMETLPRFPLAQGLVRVKGIQSHGKCFRELQKAL